mmetsp:Transcript_14781/g.43422  ORF Transcript_14781/g.43422 Transcript_14781/m.43422 type:complete len:239 (+) Transcript_14781:86-802(+)
MYHMSFGDVARRRGMSHALTKEPIIGHRYVVVASLGSTTSSQLSDRHIPSRCPPDDVVEAPVLCCGRVPQGLAKEVPHGHRGRTARPHGRRILPHQHGAGDVPALDALVSTPVGDGHDFVHREGLIFAPAGLAVDVTDHAPHDVLQRLPPRVVCEAKDVLKHSAELTVGHRVVIVCVVALENELELGARLVKRARRADVFVPGNHSVLVHVQPLADRLLKVLVLKSERKDGGSEHPHV